MQSCKFQTVQPWSTGKVRNAIQIAEQCPISFYLPNIRMVENHLIPQMNIIFKVHIVILNILWKDYHGMTISMVEILPWIDHVL